MESVHVSFSNLSKDWLLREADSPIIQATCHMSLPQRKAKQLANAKLLHGHLPLRHLPLRQLPLRYLPLKHLSSLRRQLLNLWLLTGLCGCLHGGAGKKGGVGQSTRRRPDTGLLFGHTGVFFGACANSACGELPFGAPRALHSGSARLPSDPPRGSRPDRTAWGDWDLRRGQTGGTGGGFGSRVSWSPSLSGWRPSLLCWRP